MISDTEPKFDPDTYTDFGKLMDGWETRRRRIPGHDFCVIKLAAPCKIKNVLADTAFFTGNYVPRISVLAGNLEKKIESQFPPRRGQIGTAATNEEIELVTRLTLENMVLIIPMSRLGPGTEDTRKTYLDIDHLQADKTFTHIRLNIFPDGGIARFSVFGTVATKFDLKQPQVINLMSMLNGCLCVAYSNAHFGHPRNLMKPGPSVGMLDGWETARRIDRPATLQMDDDNKFLKVYGNEHSTFKFGGTAMIQEIIVDTTHFKGNFPERMHIEGALLKGDQPLEKAAWNFIVQNYVLSGNSEHRIGPNLIMSQGPFNYIRYTIFPDGGIARIRVLGYVCG